MNNREDIFDKWKENINDEWLFTELCNKIIWFNIPKEDRLKYIPYGAKKAKDKGVDAEFEGTFNGKKGKWIFQYKFFDLNKNPQSAARSNLKSKILGTKTIKSELEKSAELEPNNYVIFTNIQLTKYFRDEIDREIKKRNYSFDVDFFDINIIENLILECPIVELSFFGERPLYTIDDFSKYYFNKIKSIRSNLKLYGRKGTRKKFIEFIRGDKNVLVLSGPGGVGKTHFVIEMGKLLIKEKIQPFYLKIGAELKRDDILKILQTNNEVALIIDDAHEFDNINLILKLVSFEKIQNLKIILTTRTQLKDYLIKSSNPEDIEYIPIKPLSRRSMVAFLKNELDIADSQVRLKIFRISGGLPLFAILCYNLTKEKKLNSEDLTKDKVIKFWIKHYLSDLPDITNSLKVLEIIAAIEPISFDDENILTKISEFTNFDDFEIQEIINNLIDADYLKKYGRKIKIEQDIVADYLLYNIIQSKPKFLNKIQDNFLQLQPTNVLTNLCKVEQLGHVDILSDIMDSYYKKVPDMNIPNRLELVEALEIPAFYRPKEVLKIVNELITIPANKYKHKHRIFGEIELENRVVIDKIPQILKNLSFNYENLEKTMELLRDISFIEPTSDNYSTNSISILRDDIIGYQGLKDIVYNEKAITILNTWIKLNDSEIDGLIIDSLNGIFASKFHISLPSDESELSFQTRMYEVNREKVSKLRSNALCLLFKLTKKNRKISTRIKAIKGLNIQAPDEKELNKILNYIELNFQKENNLSILHAYSDVLTGLCSYCERKSEDNFLLRIEVLITHLENLSFDYKLYRWLVGLRRDYLDLGRDDVEKIIENLSCEAIKNRFPKDLGQFIIKINRNEFNLSNTINFGIHLGTKNPKYAINLVDYFIRKKSSGYQHSKFIGSLLTGIEKSNNENIIPILDSIYRLEGNWWNIIVEYFTFSRENIQKSLFGKIINISIHGNRETKHLLASYMNFEGLKSNNEIWWEIFGNLSKSDDEHLLKLLIEALYSKIGNNDEIENQNLESIEKIIGKFQYSENLASDVMGWFYFGKLMNLLFKKNPEWIYSFLENRIESWVNKKTAEDFIPIPYGDASGDIFSDIRDDNNLFEKTIIWILNLAEKDSIYAFEASILFSAISPTLDDKTQEILLKWAKGKDLEKKLVEVSYVIRECKKDDKFWKIAKKILELSKGNQKVQDSLSATMHTTGAIFGSFIPIFEEQKKIMEKWEKSSKIWVQNFAKKEIESINEKMQYHKNWEEEIYYE